MKTENPNFTLFFDPGEQAYVEETVLPRVEGWVSDRAAWTGETPPTLAPGAQVMLYLSDGQIKQFLPLLLQAEATLAVLPHPQATRFCALTGVDAGLEKAVAHWEKKAGYIDTIEIDLLYCNGRPVFSSVVIGSAFQLATSKFYPSVSFWKRNWDFVRRLSRLCPFKVEITKKDGSVLKTAVSGILVASHKTNSPFLTFIPGNSFLNDGMLDALLISPRSMMELIGYTLLSLWRTTQLPHFGAHIKTSRISFSAPIGELTFTEDGDARAESQVDLEVQKKAIEIIPGALIDLPEEKPQGKEVFKVKALPLGETAHELSLAKVPLLRRASTEEFKDLFQILRENARLKGSFMVLMILSTSLATLGLFANSSPVIIGAMILAPLMAPIISLSMGALRQDQKLMLDSTYAILAGTGVSFLFAVGITWMTPIHMANAEILARTSPNLLDLGIAVLSGIAGAYGYAREEIAKTLAGVAIAVALVPPLAVAGIGLGWWNWNIFSGASLLLLTNLAGMVLAAAFTFLILGFSPFHRAKKALLISFVLVTLFSIPLALGFSRMMYKHKLIQTLDGWQTGQVMIKDVRVQSVSPLTLSVLMVSSTQLNSDEIDAIKDQIEEKLNSEVKLEIAFAIIR